MSYRCVFTVPTNLNGTSLIMSVVAFSSSIQARPLSIVSNHLDQLLQDSEITRRHGFSALVNGLEELNQVSCAVRPVASRSDGSVPHRLQPNRNSNSKVMSCCHLPNRRRASRLDCSSSMTLVADDHQRETGRGRGDPKNRSSVIIFTTGVVSIFWNEKIDRSLHSDAHTEVLLFAGGKNPSVSRG